MKTFSEELKHVQSLIDKVNEGNKAFWELTHQYRKVTRTKLGKDSDLTYYNKDIDSPDIRAALGNDLELAVGEKKL